MNTRTNTSPISLSDVPEPEHHPCMYEGNGENNILIFFELEANCQTYLQNEFANFTVLQSDYSDSYVAEG